MSELESLSEQGRHAFFYWPILLALKQTQLEAKLAQAGYMGEAARRQSEDKLAESLPLQQLRAWGFPLPAVIGDLPQMRAERLEGSRFWLRVGLAFEDASERVLDFVRQLPNSKYERREILRMEAAHESYLKAAAEKLNRLLEVEPQELVYAALLLWAKLHGSEARAWQPIAAAFLESEAETLNSASQSTFKTTVSASPSPDEQARLVTERHREDSPRSVTALSSPFSFSNLKASSLFADTVTAEDGEEN